MSAIVIEQTKEQARLAFEVHQHASIRSVRLSRSTLAAPVHGDAEQPRARVSYRINSSTAKVQRGLLRLDIRFEMVGLRVDETRGPAKRQPPLARVVCWYEVEYSLREDFEITPNHIRAFKDGNAVFNTWPYFREYLQNSLQRMGLPPLVAPFLRLQPKTTTEPTPKKVAAAQKLSRRSSHK